MTHGSVAAKVRRAKEAHPELYCTHKPCLWRTGGGPCPRHGGPARMESVSSVAGRLQAQFPQLKETQ